MKRYTNKASFAFYLVSPWSSSTTCSRSEPLTISGTGFDGEELKALAQTW